MKRTIKYLPIDEIQPDPRNPRGHESIEDVKASILRFGFVDPIVHDGRTDRIVAGHGRQEALTALRDQWRQAANGERKVPDGIVAKGDQWHVPVVFGLSTADDNEAAALLVALNRLTETGGWLPDRQVELLQQIAESVGGLEGIGFSQAHLDALVQASQVQDLDDLAAMVGEPGEDDGWPAINIRVPHVVKAAWVAHLESHDGDPVKGLAVLLGVEVSS